MDEKRTSRETPFETGAVDAWLREALEPGPGTAERLAGAAVSGGQRTGRAFRAGIWRAAAAVVLGAALAGALLLLRPGAGKAPVPGTAPASPPGSDYLITNVSGAVQLVRLRPVPAPAFRPFAPAERGPCTTVLMNQGDVLAVYDPCGGPHVLIKGGT